MRHRIATLLLVAVALALMPSASDAAPGDFSVTPLDLDFGEVVIGSSRDIDVIVRNESSTTQTPNFSGGAPADPAHFDASQNCAGVPLSPGGTCTFAYTFHPTDTGLLQSSTTIGIDSDDFQITMSGLGSSPLSASRSVVDFGDVAPGRSRSAVVVVTNTSTTDPVGPLNVLEVEPPSAAMSAVTDCAGKILSFGASCQVTLTFSPTRRGRVLDVARLVISPTRDPQDGLDAGVALTGCGAPCRVRHPRQVSLALGTGPTASGRVVDTGGAPSCRSGATVRIQHRASAGGWREVRTTRTDRHGRYRVGIPDLAGRFRALLVKRAIYDGSVVCLPATSKVRRRK